MKATQKARLEGALVILALAPVGFKARGASERVHFQERSVKKYQNFRRFSKTD